jgi:hypothetical protein
MLRALFFTLNFGVFVCDIMFLFGRRKSPVSSGLRYRDIIAYLLFCKKIFDYLNAVSTAISVVYVESL